MERRWHSMFHLQNFVLITISTDHFDFDDEDDLLWDGDANLREMQWSSDKNDNDDDDGDDDDTPFRLH